MRPVVVVHGTWDDARTVAPLVRALSQRGFPHLSAIALSCATAGSRRWSPGF